MTRFQKGKRNETRGAALEGKGRRKVKNEKRIPAPCWRSAVRLGPSCGEPAVWKVSTRQVPSPTDFPRSWGLQARGSAHNRVGLRRRSREPRTWRLKSKSGRTYGIYDKVEGARDTFRVRWLAHALTFMFFQDGAVTGPWSLARFLEPNFIAICW